MEQKTMNVCMTCQKELEAVGFSVKIIGEMKFGTCECCLDRAPVYPAVWEKKKKRK